MKFKVTQGIVNQLLAAFVSVIVLLPCECQRPPSLPFDRNSFRQFVRATAIVAPKGRSANYKDITLRFYGGNCSSPSSSFQLRAAKRLLAEPAFRADRPTILYAHGYVEFVTDLSVRTVVSAYVRRGGWNVLVLDWANLAVGSYLVVAGDLPAVGREAAVALLRLIKRGLDVRNLHLVGHSMGAHVLSYAARHLAARNLTVPRLTGLDPAYPGYYPPLLGTPMSAADASFVDVIHTDGGGYGTPTGTGHADFWPNEGGAKQPGCPTATLPFTSEDFCSHWRSWAFWAESVVGGEFLARRCSSYDAFLRQQCRSETLVRMGLPATSELRGNFYLRTATKPPYALGAIGAD